MIRQEGTRRQSAPVGFRLGPVNAPSVAMSVKIIRVTPHSAIFTASVPASIPLVSSQPRTATLPSRILAGDSAEDYAGDARIKQQFGILFRPDPAADFAGNVNARADAPDGLQIDRMPRPRAVEVDKVNDFRTVVPPFDGLFGGIVPVDSLSGVVALEQADAAPVAHIDSRYDQHGSEPSFPQIVTKFLSMASPHS